MATAATSLLGLALPVTGELSGTWGDTVNVSITALLDTAVAGTTTLSADSDVTLTTTTLAANQARQAIILWTAGGTVTRTITVPAQSKSYIVINKTSSSQSIKIVGAGPTTGVTIVAGTAAFVVWNGVDFVTASVTSTTGVLPVANGGTGLASGTSGGVLAYTATGTLASSAALAASALVIGGGAGAAPSTTTTGTGVVTALGVNTGTAGAFVVNGGALGTPSSGTLTNATGLPLTTGVTGTLPTANGGTNLTSFTSGGVVYASSTSALATGSALVFDGTNLGVSGNANFGNSGSSSYGGYATGGRIFSLAAAGGVIPAISASTDTTASSTAIRAYTKEIANDTSYAFDIQTGNGSGVTTQKLQLTWGANGLWSSTGLAVTGTLSATGTLSGGTSGTAYSFSGSAPATSLTLDSSGNTLLGYATALANGKLQVSGSIGLSGNTEIRQATNGDGNTLRLLATQVVVGNLNSTSYSYAGTGILTSISTGDGILLLDAGFSTSTFGRFKVTNSVSPDIRITLEKNGVYTLYADTASGSLGIGAAANASAILDAQSTTKGVRMPNMTTTQKNAIATPAAGLMVFDTTLAKLCVYSGAAWQTITSV